MFRKFMIKNFVGLDGFVFRWGHKKVSVTWLKGGPKFYLYLVIVVGIPTILFHIYNEAYEWIPIIPAALFVIAFEFVKYYSIKHPLTLEEVNDLEKQGYEV